MSGLEDLDRLLSEMRPVLSPGDYVFCVLPEYDGNALNTFSPLAVVAEAEGLTLVLSKQQAEQADLKFDGVFREVLLQVHSSLSAVGLTAAVSGALAARGISANMIAGCYHDHVLVPADRAAEALRILESLSEQASGA